MCRLCLIRNLDISYHCLNDVKQNDRKNKLSAETKSNVKTSYHYLFVEKIRYDFL